MGRIGHWKVFEDTGEEVPSDQIVKNYEISRDRPVRGSPAVQRWSLETDVAGRRGVDVRAVVQWSPADAFVRIPLIPTAASMT